MPGPRRHEQLEGGRDAGIRRREKADGPGHARPGRAKIGTIVDLYYDAEADEPGWALLNTADIGASMSLVPIGQAVEDGNEIRVPYHRAFVEAAPGMGAGGRWTHPR